MLKSQISVTVSVHGTCTPVAVNDVVMHLASASAPKKSTGARCSGRSDASMKACVVTVMAWNHPYI